VRVLVLQHIACEPPGIYEDVLRERGAELVRVELDEGERIPDGGFDAIVAMGGPMSVNDEASLPWLAGEKRFIADAVRSGTPYWGVCLGVQLLASSLGARVYPGSEPEVGILPVELTEEAALDPVFSTAPSELVTLQWHGDTFDLPHGAVRLAGSPAYRNQAFRFENAYGVQFHLEVSTEMAREWADVPEYATSLERVLGAGATADFVARIEEWSEEMLAHGRSLFERWLDAVVITRPQEGTPADFVAQSHKVSRCL
jgi:GMP synthase-like glutamine amidotransferase